MAEFYEMPAVSPTMEVGTLVEWKVQEGDSFEPQTVVAEVGTDKANMEAEIFDGGVMIKHLVEEDAEIPPGFPIAIVGQSMDEDIDDLLAEFEKRKKELDEGGGSGESESDESEPDESDESEPDESESDESEPSDEEDDDDGGKKEREGRRAPPRPRRTETVQVRREWDGRPLPRAFMDPPGDLGAGRTAERIPASPLARRIAADKGVDLARVEGTGPGGRIVKDDVLAAAEKGTAAPAAGVAAAAPREDEVVKNSPMRKTIARRLLESHRDIPTFYLTIELDMDAFVELRQTLKAQLPDVKISYNDMLTLAVAKALRAYPKANASWGDKAITRHGSVDVGIAVALPDGLITPVLRNADQKSLQQIGAEIRELAGLARDQKLQPDQYEGNTFTISNLGMMGIQEFTAIINPPASAILAVGTLERKPVLDEDDELVIAHRMKVTMTCDHRVIDGATGAEFLQVLRRYVESPAMMLV